MDLGTGLFLADNLLLGVAVQLTIENCEYTICALLHNDRKIIMDFVNKAPDACE